jgi:hypothetical protein
MECTTWAAARASARIRFTPDAKAFHAEWEVRANSLYAFAVRRGIFNMDEYRHAIERMDRATTWRRAITSAR